MCKSIKSYQNFEKNNIRRILYSTVPLYPMLLIANSRGVPLALFLYLLPFVYFLCCGATEDLLTRTIPDFFNAVLFVSGIFYQLQYSGTKNTVLYIASAAVCLALLTFISVLGKGGIGGGDIKMLSGAAALLGFSRTLTAFCIAVFGAAIASIFVIVQGKLRNVRVSRRNFSAAAPKSQGCTLVCSPALCGEGGRRSNAEPHGAEGNKKRTSQTIPFGPFIAVGVLLQIFQDFT